jgi:ABC-type multidrug transport system fused ATPase/permease subunit
MRHFVVVVCLSVFLNQVRKLHLHLFWNGCMLHVTHDTRKYAVDKVLRLKFRFFDDKNTDLFSLKVTCKYS